MAKTVADLIKELQTHPQDAHVVFVDWEPPNYLVKKYREVRTALDTEGTRAESDAGVEIPKRVVFHM